MAVPPVAVGQPVTAQKINAIISDISANRGEMLTWTVDRNANQTTLHDLYSLTLVSDASRPAMSTTPIRAEIGTRGIGDANRGFLRLSAGGWGGTQFKPYIDLIAASTSSAGPNNPDWSDIVFGTAGVDRWRMRDDGLLEGYNGSRIVLIDRSRTQRLAAQTWTQAGEITHQGLDGNYGQLQLSAGGGGNRIYKSYVHICGFLEDGASQSIVMGTAGIDRFSIDAAGHVRVLAGDFSVVGGSVNANGNLTITGSAGRLYFENVQQPRFWVSTSAPPSASWIWIDTN